MIISSVYFFFAPDHSRILKANGRGLTWGAIFSCTWVTVQRVRGVHLYERPVLEHGRWEEIYTNILTQNRV